jgi:hypothetical protein
MYDILSLSNSTLLTADMILLCTRKPVPNSWFSFLSPLRTAYSPHPLLRCTGVPSDLLHSHRTYILKDLTNCYDLPYIFRIYYFPCTKSHVHFAWRSVLLKEYFQIRGPFWRFVKMPVLMKSLTERAPTKLEEHPLSAVHYCLVIIYAVTAYNSKPSPPSTT